MSLKSYILNQLGHQDIDRSFSRIYHLSFKLQQFFDFNSERKQLLSKVENYTHVNYQRLRALYDIAEKVSEQKMPGSFVETGVWRGGCAGILAYVAKKHKYHNNLYFFDSFEGLPEPSEKDGKDAMEFAIGKKSGALKSIAKVEAGDEYIKELLFEHLNIDKAKVYLVKGWFQNTLPTTSKKLKKIAILRLDGDWYDSTKIVLDWLYDSVVPGGYIIIDDYYYWDGCKQAIQDFIKERGLSVKIYRQDVSGAYFIKQ